MSTDAKLLPHVIDRKHYAELFSENQVWVKPIEFLAKKHDIKGTLLRGVKGSHIVYRVGNYWIKLMAPMFSIDMSFELAGLKSIQGQMSINIPQIIATGILEDWHYVILTHVEGERIGDVWMNFDSLTKVTIAKQIAKATMELQSCTPHGRIFARGDWKNFITERFQKLELHHQSKNLEKDWLENLDQFVNQFDLSEFLSDKPVFLHSDLTWDHFLVKTDYKAQAVSGIIDFADCRVGHSEYDIPALACFIFKGEREALRQCLLGLNFKESQLNKRLSEKIMAWTCLHFYSDLKNYFKNEMKLVPPGDFSKLAQLVFPL